MKVFVLILALVACVLAEEWTLKNGEEIKQIRTDCLKDFPLTAEQMTKMKSFDFPNELEVRKYLLCTAEKMGIFCSHEGYHADRIAKQFKMDMEESEVEKLANDCIEQFPKGDKANDVAAYEVHSCLMKTVIGQKVKTFIKKRQEAASTA